ncbi:MAG: hypothetical protein KKB37_05590, partial [Alphaproteobacteria bacterium]|nr:hypothetical protein [Alphaproteobacteria bacterium]
KIGPDIVDAPELQPGTPVAFAVPALGLVSELIWPDLPVTIPEKLPSPLLDAVGLRASKLEQSRRAAERARLDAAEPSPKPVRVTRLASVTAAAQTGEAPFGVASSQIQRQRLPEAPPPLPEAPSSSSGQLVMPAFVQREQQPDQWSAGGGRPARPTPQPHQIAALQWQARLAAFAVHAARSVWLSVLLALLAVPAVVLALWPVVFPPPAGGVAPARLEAAAGTDWVHDTLAAGNRSPGGMDASGMTAGEALKQAEKFVLGDGAGDNLEERRFWLRKSISLMLAEPRNQWSLTQLGAIHTDPEGQDKQPDYRAAKTLWEIASASGDSVATCFLAKLYELGLGVPAEKQRAAQWLGRARQMGGCSLEQEGADRETNKPPN